MAELTDRDIRETVRERYAAAAARASAEGQGCGCGTHPETTCEAATAASVAPSVSAAEYRASPNTWTPRSSVYATGPHSRRSAERSLAAAASTGSGLALGSSWWGWGPMVC